MDYNARFYSPYLNRFVSPDTIVPQASNPQSLNRYSYVYNNPVRYYDSDGHCLPFCAIVAYEAYRHLPREYNAAGARFVANQGIPVVSDFAALDAANADNMWLALNGDQVGLTTEQRVTAYENAVVGGVAEGVIIYAAAEVGAATLAGAKVLSNLLQNPSKLKGAIDIGNEAIESTTKMDKIASQLQSKADLLNTEVSGNMQSLSNPQVQKGLDVLNNISANPDRIWKGTWMGQKVYEYIQGGIGVVRDQTTGALISVTERVGPHLQKLQDFVDNGTAEWLK